MGRRFKCQRPDSIVQSHSARRVWPATPRGFGFLTNFNVRPDTRKRENDSRPLEDPVDSTSEGKLPRLLQSERLLWVVSMPALGLLFIVLYWYPVQRLGIHAPINYNEGWNSYRAHMAADGVPLYGAPPHLSVTNYPPLSFHLVGFFGKPSGQYTSAGRWISLVSLAVIIAFAGLLAWHVTGKLRLGIYAAMLFGTAIAVFLPDRIGMNDPQLLGLALSAAGLYVYARNPDSAANLCLSGLAFAASLFIKHNLLAFPFAVGAHLLLNRAWRRGGTWLGALVAGCLTLLWATYYWDGPYFFTHLLIGRGYSYFGAWNQFAQYLMIFQIAFVLCVLWSIRNATSRTRNLFGIAFVIACALGYWFAGGDGVAGNVMFDALFITAIIAALVVDDFMSKRSWNSEKAVLLLLLLVPYSGILVSAPERILSEREAYKMQATTDAAYSRAVQFLKNRPGNALCEDLLLCHDSGKPQLYDPFFGYVQIRIARMQEAEVVKMFRDRSFSTIELSLPQGASLTPQGRTRFTAQMMEAIVEQYRPVLHESSFMILIPKSGP